MSKIHNVCVVTVSEVFCSSIFDGNDQIFLNVQASLMTIVQEFLVKMTTNWALLQKFGYDHK